MKNVIQTFKADIREFLQPVKNLTRLDYLAVLAAVLAAFLVFDTSTIIQTASASFGYLNRQFFNFYDYARNSGIMELSYMPAVYLTYAVWNLPLKLTFLVRYPMPEVPYLVLLWYKLLLVLLYFACAYLVYRIALEIGMGIKKSKLCAVAAFTMPVGFFLQFAYGQVMVMPLFFVLLGILCYLREKRWGFVGCFAAAIAYQQYILVLFLPLLLLKEKRLRCQVESLVAAVLPYALEYLIYCKSAMFQQNVAVYRMGQNFSAGLDNGIFVIQYVVLIWILLLGAAYFTNPKSKKDLISYALFYVGLTGAVTLCLTDWKAEYFMILVPISVLSAFLQKDVRIFLILDMAWAVVLAAYVLIQKLMPDSLDMVASLYTILVIVIAVFKHPSFLADKPDELPDVYAGWLRARFVAGAVLCLVPALTTVLLG